MSDTKVVYRCSSQAAVDALSAKLTEVAAVLSVTAFTTLKGATQPNLFASIELSFGGVDLVSTEGKIP